MLVYFSFIFLSPNWLNFVISKAFIIYSRIVERESKIENFVPLSRVVNNPLNKRVFFEVSIGNSPTKKRIEFELFSVFLPKTTENFRFNFEF